MSEFTIIKNRDLIKSRAYINGNWSEAADQLRFEVTNPFDRQVVAGVTDCSVIETKKAIDAANQAFKSWSQMTGTERGQILRKWFELQMENLEDLAVLLTIEQGKPLAESMGEVRYGASFVEWFAEESK